MAASFVSSYITTDGSAVSRAADDLTFPISFGWQTFTAYSKIVVRDTFLRTAPPGTTVWSLGSDGSDWVGLISSDNAGNPRVFVDDGSDAIGDLQTSGLGASFADVVETRVVVDPGGTHVIGASLNGGSEVTDTASDTLSFPSSISDPTLYIGRRSGGSRGLDDHISGPIIAPGVRTMDEMRRLAGN